MYDVELAREIVRRIQWSIETIAKRFAPIQSPQDFSKNDDGLEKLDAICMQLITIGESVKNLDKVTGGSLLVEYPEIEWKRIMGIRDVISHHYFDVDEEVVFSVCAEKLEELGQAMQRMSDGIAEGKP